MDRETPASCAGRRPRPRADRGPAATAARYRQCHQIDPRPHRATRYHWGRQPDRRFAHPAVRRGRSQYDDQHMEAVEPWLALIARALAHPRPEVGLVMLELGAPMMAACLGHDSPSPSPEDAFEEW